MNLLLERNPSGVSATIGKLSIDGEFECFTLEDIVREVDDQPVSVWKVPGKTAIPAGTYRLIINQSARFKVRLPLLLDVIGFAGIRIHPGNTDEDTEGCILPGRRVAPHGEAVEQSRAAFEQLFDKLDAALEAGEEVWITIENGAST
jgi:hypothetical protein